MIQRFQNLSLVLERMCVLYQRVLHLLDNEKNQLILLDFENLYPVMREKDEILTALRALDKDRLRIQDQCAMVMGYDAAELTLRGLADLLIAEGGPSYELGQRLGQLRQRLAEVIADVSVKINRNKKFIERSVASLQSVAGHLSRALAGKHSRNSGTGTYTGRARLEKNENTGSIVEKRL